MKAVTGAMAAHLAGSVTTLALLWRITRTDNVVLGFTTHHEPIIFQGTTYVSAQGFSSATITATSGVNPDTMDTRGFMDALGIEDRDVLNGLYDSCAVDIVAVNYMDLTMGGVILRTGTIGELRFGRLNFEVEIRGLLLKMHREICEIYSPGCRADLGDTRCGVPLNPSTWLATTVYAANTLGDAKTGSWVRPTTPNGAIFRCTTPGTSGGSEPTWNTTPGATTTDGTVTWTAVARRTVTGSLTSVISKRVFLDTARTEATGFFDQGILTWLTGQNAGASMEVKHWDLTSKQLELVLPMNYPVAASDTYSMHRGCDKTIATCQTIFLNQFNFRGEPHVPAKAITSIPSVAQGGGLKSTLKA